MIIRKLVAAAQEQIGEIPEAVVTVPVSYTHLRAHETVLDLVCRLLLEKHNLPELIYMLA